MSPPRQQRQAAATADWLDELSKLSDAERRDIVEKAVADMIASLSLMTVPAPALGVGSIVHFYTLEASQQTRGMNAGPYAAMIMRLDFARADLWVFAPNRPAFGVFGVERGGAENLTRGTVPSEDDEDDSGPSRWWQPKP